MCRCGGFCAGAGPVVFCTPDFRARDGGYGDAARLANGIIVDPGGIVSEGSNYTDTTLARISHEEFILIIKTARYWFNNRRLSTILTTLI